MVTLVFRSQEWQVSAGMTARDAIKKVGLQPESVLIVVEGHLITDDVILKDGQRVKLVAVVSGG
jgi:sulfur carrier protein